jgi:hypothetical protein
METLLQHLLPGKVYRRAELEFYSTAIDRHLAQLVAHGQLTKVQNGLYYVPKQSKFGPVPPSDQELIRSFLHDDDHLLLDPSLFNGLGFGLTQLYAIPWVYNHKRQGIITLNGKKFEFKRRTSFPTQLTPEFLLVDLLNNLPKLPDSPTRTAPSPSQLLTSLNPDLLLDCTRKYAKGHSKKTLLPLLRKNAKTLMTVHPAQTAQITES